MTHENSLEASALQRQVCARLGFSEVAPDAMVALATSTLGRMPIHGARIPLPEHGTVSWFFHCGEYSSADDFYQPVHVEHLAELLPWVIAYLRLPPMTRFIIDDAGYEDVWMAERAGLA
jgi:hypothetical protein